MRCFDLHCDTLTECCKRGLTLGSPGTQWQLRAARAFERYVQVFAIFIPDTLRGAQAVAYFQKNLRFFQEQKGRLAGVHPLLSVEGGSVLAGSLERVALLCRAGVRLLTLTWNGDNEIGSGVRGSGGGLTTFGKRLLPALEEAGIYADLSHLNEVGFWEVARLSRQPLLASHSNARAICNHPRNLTDAQFCAIRDSGGLVGLNFYRYFISEDGANAGWDGLWRHIAHFLALGGEQVLALGGDLDGAAEDPHGMAPGLDGNHHLPGLYEYLSHRLDKSILNRLFYENASRFFSM